MTNEEIASIFDEVADLLEIEGANPFRIRAYRNAARAIRLSARRMEEIPAGELRSIPGVGERIAAHISEILATGTTSERTHLLEKLPQGLCELLGIPALGPHRVKVLHERLGIQNLDQLREALSSGRLATVRGFGPRTIASISRSLQEQSDRPRRVLLTTAASFADVVTRGLREVPGVHSVIVAGSYRRAQETVGDLDILVSCTDPDGVMDAFVKLGPVAQVVSRGESKCTAILGSGLQADLRVVAPSSFGAALHYFTGSKAHNIHVRWLARKQGLKISEYGVFRDDVRIAGETEESVFSAVGLPWIPPELRENRGEIEAAREGRLPELVSAGDLRGDLHSHTLATDGRNTLEQMAEAAQARGLEYLAITEHSPRLTVARGLKPEALAAHCRRIDELNHRLTGITLLKGIEVDILDDGRLDMTDEMLDQLEVVVAAVHSRFNLSRDQQTERILRAMDHPRFMILAHPSGRLIGRRQAYEVDIARILRKARERGCFVELDGQPDRLDLSDIHCRMAKDAGVLVSISSDAHSTRELEFTRYGASQARRAWLEKKDVLNTRPLAELRALLDAAAKGIRRAG